MDELLQTVRACRLCETQLSPRPVLRASPTANLLIVGQAPGTRVHASGIPWDDQSGRTLRRWLEMEPATFYDESRVAIVPMGFCYPGTGKSGDLPPSPVCAPTWHPPLLAAMPGIRLTLLIGAYAQARYLPISKKTTLTDTVRRFREWGPHLLPLPHPSPRNQRWWKNNPWFEAELLPELRARLSLVMEGQDPAEMSAGTYS